MSLEFDFDEIDVFARGVVNFDVDAEFATAVGHGLFDVSFEFDACVFAVAAWVWLGVEVVGFLLAIDTWRAFRINDNWRSFEKY